MGAKSGVGARARALVAAQRLAQLARDLFDQRWRLEYARLLAAAKVEGDEWYAAVCLTGEAGLRVGEVKALRWREDVDLIARPSP